MATLDALVSLDLRMLLPVLVDEFPNATDLDPDDWRALVELMTTRIQAEGAMLRRDQWRVCSDVVMKVYASAEASGAIGHREAIVRRLNLTAAVVGAIGINADIELLDVQSAIDLAVSGLPHDPERIRQAALRWQQLEKDEILALRTLKNLLTPVVALLRYQSDDRLTRWLEVYPTLP